MDNLIKDLQNAIDEEIEYCAVNNIDYKDFMLAVLSFYKQFYYKLSIGEIDFDKVNDAVDYIIITSTHKNNFEQFKNKFKINYNEAAMGGGIDFKKIIKNFKVPEAAIPMIQQFANHIISYIPTKKTGSFDAQTVLSELKLSVEPNEKEYYDNLRKRISMYQLLRDNEYYFYNNYNNYYKHFLPLCKEICEHIESLPQLSKSELHTRYNRLNKSVLQKVLVNRYIALDFAIMEWKLEFEKTASYDHIQLYNEYQLLLDIAKKYNHELPK